MPSTYILDINDPDPPPIHMDCMYDLRPEESGFVLKWLLDGNPVYQWIPPKRPLAIAFFKTRADPTFEMDGDSLERYRSLNIIRPEFNMTGEFTCSVQTFESSDKRSAKLQIIGRAHEGGLGLIRRGVKAAESPEDNVAAGELIRNERNLFIRSS